MNSLVKTNQQVSTQENSNYLWLSISLITVLLLLINLSFKIILLQGLIFSVGSLLCPLISGLYLLVLRTCNFKQQKHVLNGVLVSIYLFCIGIYILVHLPAAEYMNDNPVYQIIFEDIPKKFFATTISFFISFYLPHYFFCIRKKLLLSSPQRCALLSILGGLSFFCMDFYFLFSDPLAYSFREIFIDSLMVVSFLLFLLGICYLLFVLDHKDITKESRVEKTSSGFSLYDCLLCFAVVVMLICLACEYRLIAFNGVILTASCIFFPITMVISTFIGEIWGYRANVRLVIVLVITQFVFDTFLMAIVAIPSPEFFDLTPFYNYILPRRLPAASFSLLVTFLSEALILRYFQEGPRPLPRPVRILIANLVASTLLCFVDYSLLFGGIYPYEQIVNLATNVWKYKLITTLFFLPLILWFCKLWEINKPITGRLKSARLG